jgi:hypothetical protein
MYISTFSFSSAHLDWVSNCVHPCTSARSAVYVTLLRYTEIIFAYVSHSTGAVSESRTRTSLEDGVRFAERDRNFSLHHRVQTVSGAHPASYTMDTGYIAAGA